MYYQVIKYFTFGRPVLIDEIGGRGTGLDLAIESAYYWEGDTTDVTYIKVIEVDECMDGDIFEREVWIRRFI